MNQESINKSNIKQTSDLQGELNGHSDISAFLSENADEFITSSISSIISACIKTHGLTKTALARRSGMSEVYLYQILNGRRNPSRDRLICLCIGLGCDLEEAQNILRQASLAPLYPRIRRDAVIIFALNQGWDINKLNDALFDIEEETLF